VHSPIGLELEAETPKEIAISILSEIIMIRRGGTGQPMSSLNNETEA
jgi:xanthine dehydrogenase accessory factor